MSILICGGAGYIGSHCVKLLQDSGQDCIVLDNLSTGHRASIGDTPLFVGDLRDRAFVDSVFAENKIDLVMHFAASALVGESVKEPLQYYDNNVVAAMHLLGAMKDAGCDKLVFSSTCAVYGEPEEVPIPDHCPTSPVNPYGETKRAIERMLHWCDKAYGLRYTALRYFNAAGAYSDGSIGEDHEPESHLIPNVLKAAANGKPVQIFGNDYPTPDGTCIRDYIHVTDLIGAHTKAMDYLLNGGKSEIMHLGTGTGCSNLQIVEAAKRVTGLDIDVRFAPRRPGDPPELVALPKKAKEILGWEAERTSVDTVIEDAWRWHKAHPKGYEI